MISKKLFLLACFIILISLSCKIISEEQTGNVPEHTPTTPSEEIPNVAPTSPQPTEILEPTETSDPIIFLGEFDGTLDPAWSWLNEDPDRWFFTKEGWLGLKADDPGIGNEGDINQTNLLVQDAPDGDFVVTTRLFADPNSNFNAAGIFLISDPLNYFSIISGYCMPCLPDSAGYGFFIDGIRNGEYVSTEFRTDRSALDTDVYLRLEYSSSEGYVTGYYATEADQWNELGRLDNFPTITQIALGAANLPHPDEEQLEDLMAYYDYVEVARVNTPVRSDAELPQPEPKPVPSMIPGSNEPFSVGDVQLKIVNVEFGAAMFAPAGMADDEDVLTVEVEVISGDAEQVSKSEGEFDVWLLNENDRKNGARATTATTNADGDIRTIQWLFGMAKDSQSIYLHFPSGVVVDLTQLFMP